MSTYGVRTRFVDLLVRERGRVSEATYAELVAYARERGVTTGEAKALLQPAAFVRTSRVLRTHGIKLEDVRLDAGAWGIAVALGQELGVAPLFPDLPNAVPAPAPPPGPAPVPLPPRGGQRLEPASAWRIETSGAVLTFETKVGEHVYPALVLRNPEWKDPGPARDLIAERRADLAKVTSLTALVAFVRDVVAKERAHFEATAVPARYNTERYFLQDARRHTFFEALALAAAGLRLPAADQERVPAVLAAEKERLLCDRDYEMETGSHTNYWPYWANYRGAIEKILRQTAPGTDEHLAIKNRLEDIYDRKTVFGGSRRIDEKDLETSVGGALVHRLQFSADLGHRVSLARGSHPFAPSYEVLAVASTGLPAGLAQHAGARVFRDTGADTGAGAAGALRFDPGGAPVPAALARHVHARPVDAAELGLRPLAAGEAPRPGVPWDWSRDGGIDVAATDIAWWGHCHNEAPLNAMGVDPKRAVALYRASRGVPAADALQTFTAEDVWDLFGALAADHEAGYAVMSRFGMRQTQIEVTKFVGSRHDGGHWLLLELDRPGAPRVTIDAEITELWHKSDPTERYDEPAERFRRDLPNDDGTFDPNPDWIAAEVSDEDEITLDALGRRLTFTAKYVTFDGEGNRYQEQASVELDPTADSWVKLADEIAQAEQRGGRLAEHWYNPKLARYYRATIEVGADGQRGEPKLEPEVAVARVMARQETAYDSVIDIHDFVTKNMGLPFTFDTSSGLAVWNYPVNHVRIDRLSEVERTEGGKRYSFASYRLRFATMGGPAGDARYLIKRDARGNATRALAVDPMPDFAYRNEHWVCAPVTADARGDAAHNAQALEAGYLTDKQRERLVTELWRRQVAICYASLAAPGAGAGADATVYLFEAEDGELTIFPDRTTFDAAIATARSAGS